VTKPYGILSALVFSFLSLYQTARAASQSHDAAQQVTYCQLIANPGQYVGKRVRVRAIFRYAFELQRLEPETCCSGKGPGIWVKMLLDSDSPSEKRFRRLPKGEGIALLTVIGKFEKENGMFGEQFTLHVDELGKIERTSHSADLKTRPFWASRCEAQTNRN